MQESKTLSNKQTCKTTSHYNAVFWQCVLSVFNLRLTLSCLKVFPKHYATFLHGKSYCIQPIWQGVAGQAPSCSIMFTSGYLFPNIQWSTLTLFLFYLENNSWQSLCDSVYFIAWCLCKEKWIMNKLFYIK